MDNMTIDVSSCTILGDRSSQQDACRYETCDGKLFAAVCDGMGGMAGGDIAGVTAVSYMFDRFKQDASAITKENSADWFNQIFRGADDVVSNLRDSDGNLMNGGSTVVAVLIQDGTYQWGSVGDSRIYLIRGGVLQTLTRSHNYFLQLDEMARAGTITEEQKQEEARRGEALISYLGMHGLNLLDTGLQAEKLNDGDVLVLVSDGVYKSLTEEQISAIIDESGRSSRLMAERLCSAAKRIGHLNQKKQDNTTVIILQAKAVS